MYETNLSLSKEYNEARWVPKYNWAFGLRPISITFQIKNQKYEEEIACSNTLGTL